MEPIQQPKETVAMELGALLDAGDGAVVTLVAGDTRLAAHRAVLAARSPVFAAMLHHDSLEDISGQVEIPDVEGPVLRQLLASIYTLQVPELPGMASQLLAAADRYSLSVLKAQCEEQVAAQLSVETAAATAILAIRHSSARLTETAINFIKANVVQVMATQEWADAIRYHPEDVIEVSRLLSQPPAETKEPATADSTQAHCDHGRTPTSAAPPAAARQNPPPDDIGISSLRHLSAEEKNRRLLQAAEQGAVDLLRTLLTIGADVRAREGYRWSTALHLAAQEGHLEAVKCLLESGADVTARDQCRETALHDAARCGHAAVVRLLLVSAADPNARGQYGMTPLHWTADHRHLEAAVALLEAGADKGIMDDKRKTPLDIARNLGHQQIVEILTQKSSATTSVK